MAEMDYRPSNLSLMSPPSVIHDEQGLGLPAWEIMSISQVLLPVLCAMFIAVVIIVIACCLIQKKSKSSGVVRQKSSHTIETLHEVSEHDIYDVIDEVRCRSCSPDKFHRRQDKLDSSILTFHHLPQTKLSNVFANNSAGISFNCTSKFDILTSRMSVRNSKEWMLTNRGSVSNDARLSTHTDGGVSSTSNEDDGIYETLDRHWTLKNEQRENGAMQNGDKKLAYPQKANCRDSCNESCLKHSNIPETPIVTEHSSDCQNNSSKSECQLSDLISARGADTRKLVCQITMFEITNAEEKPAIIETSYYQVQPHISALSGNKLDSISDGGQNSNLRIVQEGTSETSAKNDLVLKPINDEDILKHHLPDSAACTNSHFCASEKTTKVYEKLHKSMSKRYPTLLVKKAESFRSASSELNAAKEQHRIHRRKSDSSDIDAQSICARTPSRQANISAGPETTRILTKLGPLPPVPVQQNASKEKASPKCNADKYTLDADRNEVKSDQSSERPVISVTHNVHINSLPTDSTTQSSSQENPQSSASFPIAAKPPNETRTKDAAAQEVCSLYPGTFCNRVTVTVTADDCDNPVSNLSSHTETLNTESSKASRESVCTASTDSVCDNLPSDRDDEGSNYYFVLEPRDGASSSRNSSVDVASSCEEVGSIASAETH